MYDIMQENKRNAWHGQVLLPFYHTMYDIMQENKQSAWHGQVLLAFFNTIGGFIGRG